MKQLHCLPLTSHDKHKTLPTSKCHKSKGHVEDWEVIENHVVLIANVN